MSDYGPECTGGVVNAAATSFLRITFPFVASLCTPAQLEKGDRYRKECQALLDQYFDKFKDHTKNEIKGQLRRIEQTKKRINHTSWIYQKEATVYRQLTEKLYHVVNDLSNQLNNKAMFERNNMSYSTIHTLVLEPDNPDAIPLDSMRAITGPEALAQITSSLEAHPEPRSSPGSNSTHRSTPSRIDIHASEVPLHVTELPSRPEAARTRAVATITAVNANAMITAANANATITAANTNASDESLGLRRLFPTSSRGQETVR